MALGILPTFMTSVAMNIFSMFTIDFALKDEIYKDPCFHPAQQTHYPLLPLITVNYPNKSLNLGRNCEVCCQKDYTAKLDFYQTDPTLTDEIKLYYSGEIEVPVTWIIHNKSRQILRIHFYSPTFRPGEYELRTRNRYGSTSVRFKVLFDSTEAGCTSPLHCKLKRPGRLIAS